MLQTCVPRRVASLGLPLCLMLVSCQHAAVPAPVASGGTEPPDVVSGFETRLQALVEAKSMTGVSAGILKDGALVWSRGFGFADLENNVAATPDTPYKIDTCSEVFAAVLVMRLVEEGMVALDDPMADYSIHSWQPPTPQANRYGSGQVTVRDVLADMSDGGTGAAFRFDPSIYRDLTWVVEQGSGLSYPNALARYILEPAGMVRTVPGQLHPGYEKVLADLAKPYSVQSGNPLYAAYRVLGLRRLFEGNRSQFIEPVVLDSALEDARRDVIGAAYTPLYGVNASVGVITTVQDLARFDAALDRNTVITESSKNDMFTAVRSPSGTDSPRGLGWFVQEYDGVKVVWSFGDANPSVSALYIKVPDRRLTFLALSNTDRLCAGTTLSQGDLSAAPVARLFLETFVAKPGAERPETSGQERSTPPGNAGALPTARKAPAPRATRPIRGGRSGTAAPHRGRP